MKATEFDFSKDLKFNLETGQTVFLENRLVIFDSNAIGLLRQDLINNIGWENARKFFLKFGYQNGYSDFMQMKINYEFDNELQLLSAGPVIHTWEGIVKASPKTITFDKKKGTMDFSGVWINSYEAEQHLSFNNISKEPVCWTLMGYASGWASAFMGTDIIAIEPVCVGKGDEHCEWLLKDLPSWEPDIVAPYKEALKDYIIGGK